MIERQITDTTKDNRYIKIDRQATDITTYIHTTEIAIDRQKTDVAIDRKAYE